MKKSIKSRKLSPLRSVNVITETGLTILPIEEISIDKIGCKAYGLASLPSEWVPRFFVINAFCFEDTCSKEAVNAWITECLTHIGINDESTVMVRSSGMFETMQTRGRLKSNHCTPNKVTTTIHDLIQQLSPMSNEKVHWIVQKQINAKRLGHLSNERYLSKEARDWVVEFEIQENYPGQTQSIAVRQWRDGTDISNSDLDCTSEFAISYRLKTVAKWATQLTSRTHFEWIWDGKMIHIVQADEAELATGVNPRSLLPNHVKSVEPNNLKLFRIANNEDYKRYGKLKNVKLYKELGYNMPIFYVLDDKKVMGEIFSNQISHMLGCDLTELTKRPLIIRTDGISIPVEKNEMLPRSDELRSQTEAINWLCKDFKFKIESSGLRDCDICLIAHHFIPSVASAWARAEPGNRIVRIESLWGLPEGLYWYSHDTFEVHTKTGKIEFGRQTTLQNYKELERLRYKGTFIAPNENGKWIHYNTKSPYDWNKSINNKKRLFEIAHTTRQVAEYENYAVIVMWFIDNHLQATEHKVLPWYHCKSESLGSPKAAPRQKHKRAHDFSIKNKDDWQQLKQNLQSGKHIERVVVEPDDPELIRNQQFAKELADLAATKKFVIELAGGILSHVYYILQSHGAKVECIDLFGAEEDIVEYDKLVRDKIPNLIEGRGERVETIKLQGDALLNALRQKLVEEAFEVLDAKPGDDLIGELADLQEVVRALCSILKVSTNDIDMEREEKEKKKGGFEKGLMLIKTTTPHSLQKHTIPTPPTLELKTQQSSESVVSDVEHLPSKPLYRRPDLRQVNQQLEKLFTFEAEINRIGEVKETLDFSMPIGDQQNRGLSLTVELRRTRSSVRGIVRLRLHPSQLKFAFPD